MSDFETPPPEDADRPVSDSDEIVDPEAPTDSPVVHPPREDADRPAAGPEDPDDAFQEENAATSLDQPSEQST